MKRVVCYGIDILIRNEEENNIDLEELIAEALEEKGLYVLGVSFNDDLTENKRDCKELFEEPCYQHCESANEDYFECMNDYYDGAMEV